MTNAVEKFVDDWISERVEQPNSVDGWEDIAMDLADECRADAIAAGHSVDSPILDRGLLAERMVARIKLIYDYDHDFG